ncbi:MAG: AgmX/PglI C-terminal domain-containing protein [Deltaproteobacteria bacterium]|nr:AgmX/PglI C-terminal domain-containing protein [Deltaproteobacteria bacterium]
MKRGVLVALAAMTLGACSRQRDRRPAPAGGQAQAPGGGAGATPRELPSVGASDAGVAAATAATAATVAPDAALAAQGGKRPDTAAQQQLDDQALRMLAVLGSRGNSRGGAIDKVFSAPDLDLSAAARADRFSDSGGTGGSGGGVNVGASGGSLRSGAGSVGGPALAGGPGTAGGGVRAAPTGPRAVVTVESVTVVVGDVPDALAGVMRRFSGVRACYQRQLTEDPSLAGRLQVSLIVGDDGTVRSASVQPDGLDDPQLVRCVSAVMQRIRFTDASAGAELQVSFTLAAET